MGSARDLRLLAGAALCALLAACGHTSDGFGIAGASKAGVTATASTSSDSGAGGGGSAGGGATASNGGGGGSNGGNPAGTPSSTTGSTPGSTLLGGVINATGNATLAANSDLDNIGAGAGLTPVTKAATDPLVN